MTPTPFDDATFPTAIALRSVTRPGYKTRVQEWHDGGELRAAEWQLALRTIDVAHGIKTPAGAAQVLRFYHARGGPQEEFRMRDWSDWTTDPTHRIVPTTTGGAPGVITQAGALHEIGAGDNTAGMTFQLRKWYRDGDSERVRPITLPTQATDPNDFQYLQIASKVGQLVPLTIGVGWTLDRATGIATVVGVVPVGWIVSWAGTFDIVAQFDPTLDETILQQVSLATKTVGSTEQPGNHSVGAVNILEAPSLVEDADPRQGGGAEAASFGITSYQLPLHGALKMLTATATGLICHLPDYSGTMPGGPIGYLYNAGANAVQVNDFAGNVVISTFSPGQDAELFLRDDNTVVAI